MAYGLSIEAFIRIRDAKGKESEVKFNHPVNVDLGALKGALRSTAGLIDAMIRGQVIGAGIRLIVNLPGNLTLKASAIAGSDIEEGVRFSWKASSGGETEFRVPTVSEDWLTDQGVIDYTSGDDFDDFIQRILQGRTQGLINASPSDAYGSDIASIIGGVESFIASRA